MKERIVYADKAIQERIKTEFELVENKGWYLLYRNRTDNTFWRLDKDDRFQEQCLVRIDDVENWDRIDDRELRIELLKMTRGTDDKICTWSACTRLSLKGLAFCERHAYEEMGIRR